MNNSAIASGVPLVILHDAGSRRWLRFHSPAEVVVAHRTEEVLPCLRQIEKAVDERGQHAAGWISYEAAPAFDAALTVRPSGSLPLLWFGLFPAPEPMELPNAPDLSFRNWRSSVSPADYEIAFDSIQRHIHEGHTYQVNFSYRLLHDAFDQDPWRTFLFLAHAQRAVYGAYLATDAWRICSASPELFFRLDGTKLESRPMKGTAPRGRSSAQDRSHAEGLLACEKNRAENLMIVDMVRHDMGRICTPGSILADPVCALEKYPTVWQMTSTVRGETYAPISEIFRALFPAASITGAPKKRTMEIIAELETSPRQIYTGTVGFLSPGRRAQFNVAIRTLLIDQARSLGEYGVGGGIVWDSDRAAEQAECRTKARILSTPPRPPFSLLETMLWTPEDGIRLLELHLARMRDSASYFDYAFPAEHIREQIEDGVRGLPPTPHRLRLLLAERGQPTLQTLPLTKLTSAPFVRLALARRPVDSANVFLFHKTTHRRVYEEAKADFPLHDDVILFNENGDVTESTIATVVVEIDGVLCTPPVECGLLPGTARAEFLARGLLREQRIPLSVLRAAPRLFTLNSVRGLLPAALDEGPAPTSPGAAPCATW